MTFFVVSLKYPYFVVPVLSAINIIKRERIKKKKQIYEKRERAQGRESFRKKKKEQKTMV